MIDRLKQRLYWLAFIDEFGPVYAVYTLWFNDNGISTSQVSTVFFIWAGVSLILEIPSGALADRVDRRLVLAAAFGLRATGIALWLVWPTLPGVIIGAALWATHDALASGSWEALIHDELTALDVGHRYGPVMARIGQFSNLGVAVGTIIGAVLLRVDVELITLGWITVAAHAGSILLVTTLPDVRSIPETAEDQHESPLRDWWITLKAGLAEARTSPVLARLIAVGAVLEGLFLIDDYIPLLSRARGGGDAAASIIVLVVWIGLLVGGEFAARRPDLRGHVLGVLLVAAMGITSLAFVIDAVWPLALVAFGYAILETTRITADARLQERANAATRATVTSARGFGSACVSLAMFAVIAALANGDDPTPGLYLTVAALAVVGLLIIRWLPRPSAPRSEPPVPTQAAPVG